MGTHRIRFTKVTRPGKTPTKWTHRDIRSPAYMSAALTVEWLNATKGTVAYRRVLALRAELEAFRAEIDKPFHPIEWETADRPTKASAEHLQWQNQLAERRRRIDLRLRKYSFKKALAYTVPDHRLWISEIAKSPRGPQIEVTNESGFPKVRVTEAWVAAALASLAACHELGKVHLCINCRERWHVALRSIDQYCGDKCREHFHTHSDAYREKKRASQQEYRRQFRERQIRKREYRQKGEQHQGKR